MHKDLCPSLMRLFLPITSSSVGGIRQLIVQIPRIDVTLMGYWIAGQVSAMMRSVMCKSNLRMGENILRRVLMMLCAVFFRAHLRSARSIALLGSGRGVVDGPGDTI